KFSGDIRNPLNLHKISGLRIYIKKDGIYRLLGLPSLYDMGGVSSLWYYKLDDDTITIKAYVDIHENVSHISFESLLKKTYDLILTEQILMGPEEGLHDISIDETKEGMVFNAPQNSMAYHKYPNLKYELHYDQPYKRLLEKDIFDIDDQFGLLILSFNGVSSLNRVLEGTTQPAFKKVTYLSYDEADQLGTAYFKELSQLKLTHKNHQELLDKLNHISFWYTFQALVHYASPHGLEQYSGAAWGTRDVCQGPFELFMALQRFDIAKSILIKVYQRQFIENGDFPQWYMFDQYYQIQAHESHGDIIVWPLRALAYYIEATNDLDILDELIPFMSMKENEFTEKETLLNHLYIQIKAIESSFIPGTNLPQYGGGDWDDTLQPANHDLTTKMVSGWTVALLYDALSKLGEVTLSKDEVLSKYCLKLSHDIQNDYEKHMIVDGIPAGFVIFNGEQKTYLLHPKDKQTGLKYRLLPFTRAMISEMVEPKQIPNYLSIIDKHFKHPDGVRLMDTTVKYQGGRKTFFTRAETAANFGREIGLQYVHAHIRYIEAMAKIGEKERAFEGLFTINPILLNHHVQNAYYRQSNMYFSSSDAWFKDRYEAYRDFEKIRKGEILVKGGWRLYSSGPGIYLNQLITHIIGLRIYAQKLVIDPVLPKRLDGLVVDYHMSQKPIKVKLHYGKGTHLLNNKPFKYEVLSSKYRPSGIALDTNLLSNDQNIIDYWFE
ncbi:MAG: cellobiose phosphorylase, partial [Tenericutes bacterium HGW-Tenericutes-6]